MISQYQHSYTYKMFHFLYGLENYEKFIGCSKEEEYRHIFIRQDAGLNHDSIYQYQTPLQLVVLAGNQGG